MSPLCYGSTLCQVGLMSGWPFVRSTFCQVDLLSGWHFVRLTFCRVNLLLGQPFVGSTFCWVNLLSGRCCVRLTFCQVDLLLGRPFVGSTFCRVNLLSGQPFVRSMLCRVKVLSHQYGTGLEVSEWLPCCYFKQSILNLLHTGSMMILLSRASCIKPSIYFVSLTSALSKIRTLSLEKIVCSPPPRFKSSRLSFLQNSVFKNFMIFHSQPFFWRHDNQHDDIQHNDTRSQVMLCWLSFMLSVALVLFICWV